MFMPWATILFFLITRVAVNRFIWKATIANSYCYEILIIIFVDAEFINYENKFPPYDGSKWLIFGVLWSAPPKQTPLLKTRRFCAFIKSPFVIKPIVKRMVSGGTTPSISRKKIRRMSELNDFLPFKTRISPALAGIASLVRNKACSVFHNRIDRIMGMTVKPGLDWKALH